MKKTYLFSIALTALLSFPFANSGNQLKAQIISTIAGNGTASYSGDGGPATSAEFNSPRELLVDNTGNVYIADYNNNRVRMVNVSGDISTYAGNGTPGFSGDGGQATNAELSSPLGMAQDIAGNIYIADELNSRIRKVSPSGVISTFAGNGTSGYSGDGGQATNAELNWPDNLAFDLSGNLYVVDYASNHIRKITPAGVISTVAGNGTGGFSGDGGQATNAEINAPHGIAVDASGNIYIGDTYSYRVRKVNTSGIISTVAGNGTAAYTGDGGQATDAEINAVLDVNLDNLGNLYIADALNNVIRVVNTSGVIRTFAGNGTASFSGDGGQATAAELSYPIASFSDAVGNVFIADDNNNRIRKVMSTEGVNELTGNNEELNLYPNPNTGLFTIHQSAVVGSQSSVEIYNMLGEKVYSKQLTINKGQVTIDLSDKANGIYLVKVQSEDGIVKVEKVSIVH